MLDLAAFRLSTWVHVDKVRWRGRTCPRTGAIICTRTLRGTRGTAWGASTLRRGRTFGARLRALAAGPACACCATRCWQITFMSSSVFDRKRGLATSFAWQRPWPRLAPTGGFQERSVGREATTWQPFTVAT